MKKTNTQNKTRPGAPRPSSASPLPKSGRDAMISPSTLVEKHPFAVCMVVVSVLIISVFHQFIFANLLYLFKDIGSDSLNYTYPSLVHIADYLRNEGFPLWSFSQGMGQSVANNLNDPFNFIAYLAGSDNVAYAMVWMEIAKAVATAALFYHFLKIREMTPVVRIIGAMLFTFSGFFLIGSGWSLFSTEVCYLALLLLAFERLYQRNDWVLFPVAVALFAILQPFDLYLYGLFLLGYFLLRHFSSENPSWKKFGISLLQMAGFGIVGLLISSFFVSLYFQIILESPRIGGSSSYFERLSGAPVFATGNSSYFTTLIMRLFHNDMVGNGMKYFGWYNYLEAPLFYIGLFPLVLLPQVFFTESKRKRIGYIILFALIFLTLIFPYFRYMVWLFTGDYFRGFSLYLSFPVLFFGLKVFNYLDKGGKIKPFVLGGTLVALLLLLYYPYTSSAQIIQKDIRSMVTNFIILYSLLMAFYLTQRYNRVVSLILLVIVFAEISIFSFQTFKGRDVVTGLEIKQKTGYNDYTVDAVKIIKDADKQFFRMNKSYSSGPAIHKSVNDAKVQGFFGTRSYSSFNQKYYIRFQEEMNIIEKGNETMSRWAAGLANRPVLQNLASVKYQLVKGAPKTTIRVLYDSIAMIGDVKIFKNKSFLPLGFTYDSIVLYSEFKKLSPLVQEVAIQKYCIIEDSLQKFFQNFPVVSTFDTAPNYTQPHLAEDAMKRREDTLTITKFSENRFGGTIDLEKSKILFFSIPFDQGWHCRIDEADREPLLANLGFMGLPLEKGKHRIELFFRPPLFYETMVLSMLGLGLYLGLLYWRRRSNKSPVL